MAPQRPPLSQRRHRPTSTVRNGGSQEPGSGHRPGALVGLGEHGQVSGVPCCAALLASLLPVPPSSILDGLPDPYLLRRPPCHLPAGASGGRPELVHAYRILTGRTRAGLASEIRSSEKRVLLPTYHVHPSAPPLTSGPLSLYRPPQPVKSAALGFGAGSDLAASGGPCASLGSSCLLCQLLPAPRGPLTPVPT